MQRLAMLDHFRFPGISNVLFSVMQFRRPFLCYTCVFNNYRTDFMEFFAPSHKAISTPRRQMERKYNFPFDTVPVGMSFAVGRSEVLNINVLRTIAIRNGNKLGRRFKVVDHGDGGFEVFCKEAVPIIVGT